MNLIHLVSDTGLIPKKEYENDTVVNVTCDSRKVEAGSVFVCVKGEKADGHDFAQKAIDAGAVAVVTQRRLGLDREIVTGKNLRLVYGLLCSSLYNNPSEKLKIVGVTGTNGKTTITSVVKHIIESCGHKTGLIGTIKNQIGDMEIQSKYTTPEAGQLQQLLYRMVQSGMEYAIMETSSHALDQDRCAGTKFKVGGFTNLTQDHLDYHKTMENYFEAKAKLFDYCEKCVINLDDSFGVRLYDRNKKKTLTYSIYRDADIMAKNVQPKADGVMFELLYGNNIARVKFPMPGMFSVSNALCAAGICLALGIEFDAVVEGLSTCHGVEGRTQIVPTGKNFTVMIDYAHTPDGLEKLLSSVKGFAPARLVCVYGCAGERDRTKRPKMAKIVSEYATLSVLTSDNPRGEDPMRIIEDALPGVCKGANIKVIPDRYEAIRWAIKNARDRDMIVLAGKGHEDYQVLEGCTIYFKESEVVKEAIKEYWGD